MDTKSVYNRLSGKHILLIGGSSGLGLSVAKLALAHGARVTISSSSPPRVSTVIKNLEGEFPLGLIQGFTCDLACEDVETNVETLFEQTGEVDHVVYTAADKLSIASLNDISRDFVLKVSQMRLIAPIIVAKIAAKYLPKTADSSLTLTTGTIKDRPIPGWTVTAAMAGAIQSMIQNLALEMRPVRVNGVSPGFVDTPLWDDILSGESKSEFISGVAAKCLTDRVAIPDTVAEAYLYALKDWNLDGVVISTHSGALLV